MHVALNEPRVPDVHGTRRRFDDGLYVELTYLGIFKPLFSNHPLSLSHMHISEAVEALARLTLAWLPSQCTVPENVMA
jgi:hypothetical protein